MKRIDSLTDVQTARLPESNDTWTDTGHSTEPADRPRAEASICRMYEDAGLAPPRIVWCGSPLSMVLTRAVICSMSRYRSHWDHFGTEVWDRIRINVGDGVAVSALASVADTMRDSSGATFECIAGAELGHDLRDRVRAEVRRGVRASVWYAVWPNRTAAFRDFASFERRYGGSNDIREMESPGIQRSVANAVLSAVRSNPVKARRLLGRVRTERSGAPKGKDIAGSIVEHVKLRAQAGFRSTILGQDDATWISHYAHFAEVCSLTDQTEQLKDLWDLARSSGWVLAHERICWISERHCIAHQDEDGRVHSEAGPAIAYPDGFKFYALHGVQVPSHIVEAPDQITVTTIESERSQELRRIMIDRYKYGKEVSGAAAYLHDCGAEIVDHDERWGTLRRKKRRDDTDILMVEVVNNTPEPSGEFKHYWLRVNPECRPMPTGSRTRLGEPQEPTALNAVASTWGLTGPEFARRIDATEAAGYRARS